MSNGGAEPAANVSLAGTVSGGEIVSLVTTVGSCVTGTSFDCALGELAPGASIEVSATVQPSGDQALLTVEATLESDLPCETAVDDNVAAVAIAVLLPPVVEHDPLEPGGGCACRATGEPRGAAGGWWLLAVVGLLVARARRRTAA